jgi:hypothetical protein
MTMALKPHFASKIGCTAWNADSVVQPVLDVERGPDAGWDCRIRYDGVAERGIGGRQGDGEDGDPREPEVGKQ